MSEDLEQRDGRGRTPLMRACEEGDLEQVQRLIDKGADIEAKGRRERTPLRLACSKGRESIVRLLIDKGANIDPEAIRRAAENGDAAIVERLIRAGGDINDNKGGATKGTSLIIASQEGHVDVVDCLLSLGANTEAKNQLGKTALMTASLKGMVDVVDRLLAAGCNVHAQDPNGSTALICAALEGHVSIIDRLAVHGADFNHQNDKTTERDDVWPQ